MPAQALNLWLWVGGVVAVLVVFAALNYRQRPEQPVEGSNPEQQKRANELAGILARDSSDIAAHVELGNLLYDTGNWSEAIVHYRAALRRDSSIVTALVDLGVCYYNLSEPDEAERLFRLALAREPRQPIALFNMGIVHERRDDLEAALGYFQRSAQASPAPNMQAPLDDAIARVRQKLGRGAPGGTPARGMPPGGSAPPR
jgi:Flp pilus assembly protein TadD